MIDKKLAQIAAQYDALQAELAKPETASDPAALKRLGKEQSQMEPVVTAWREMLVVRQQLAEALEMRDSGDDEMHDIAQEEVKSLEAKEAELVEGIRILLLPVDPLDEKNVIGEVPDIISSGSGRYRAEGLKLTAPGSWEIGFNVRQGKDVERLTHDLIVN